MNPEHWVTRWRRQLPVAHVWHPCPSAVLAFGGWHNMRSTARERKAGQGTQSCLAFVQALRKDACLLVGTGMETASNIATKEDTLGHF